MHVQASAARSEPQASGVPKACIEPQASGLLRDLLWPVFVLASALVYGAAFASGAPGLLVLFAIPSAQIALLFLLELWIPGEPRGAALRDPALGIDLSHTLLGNGLGGPLGQLLLLAATALAAGELAERVGGSLWPRSWPFAAQAALAIVLADGLDVLRHRAFHRSAKLWRFHALHHGGDRLHIGKSGRNHFVDVASRGLVVFVPLALLGAPGEALLAYPAAVQVLGPIAHANLDLRIPDFLHRIVLTPQGHRIHHARRPALALHNYANVLPPWDLLFGTFLDPSGRERPAAGLDDDPNPPGFLAQVLAPLGWRRGAARGA
jgi:sterol desaturase/sphingolipid hydroxylase (fatty acid hydroxylase superfamily)